MAFSFPLGRNFLVFLEEEGRVSCVVEAWEGSLERVGGPERDRPTGTLTRDCKGGLSVMGRIWLEGDWVREAGCIDKSGAAALVSDEGSGKGGTLTGGGTEGVSGTEVC